MQGGLGSRALAWLGRPEALLLFLVAIVPLLGITEGELYYNSDEARHAMNGVFFRDLLVDFPLTNPMNYALEYYAKYPAIAVAHWPPFFHIIEGLLFLILGVSVWVGRLTTILFAMVGAYFWYRIAERLGSPYRAFVSASVFALMPFIVFYERLVMLEIPSVATCLGAVHYWLRFLESERKRDLWSLAAFVCFAFLTSQKAMFLVPFILGHLVATRRFGLLRRWDVWAALAASLAIVLPWYLLTLRTVVPLTGRAFNPEFSHLHHAIHWKFYLDMLPLQMGIPLLCVSVVGIGLALLRGSRRYGILFLWVVSCYTAFTLLPEKGIRHTMVWLPPLVYFAMLGIEALCWRRKLALVIQAGLVFFLFVQAARTERPLVSGVEDVARYVLSLPESDIIYYQGHLNGSFIFNVRKLDPEKRHMVAREKQIVVTQIVYDRRQVLTTPAQVVQFLRDWGIRYVVIEEGKFLEGLEPVNQAVVTDDFEILRTFRLKGNDPQYLGQSVTVYRYRGETRRTSDPVTIPMMTIRSGIRADLNRLAGRPWPN